MPDFSTLTTRQRELYEFIRDKIQNRGYGPTVREIGLAFEIKSPNGVMCHLKALEKKDLLKRELFSARAVQLLDSRATENLVLLLCLLLHHVNTLQQEVDVLKDEAAVRESFLADVMAQKRCPDCQRPRDEWYGQG